MEGPLFERSTATSLAAGTVKSATDVVFHSEGWQVQKLRCRVSIFVLL